MMGPVGRVTMTCMYNLSGKGSRFQQFKDPFFIDICIEKTILNEVRGMYPTIQARRAA